MIRYYLFSLAVLLPNLILSQSLPPRFYYHHTHINALTKGFPTLPDNARFGEGIACLGDLDGDGIEEIAAGTPGLARGAVYILFFNAEGEVRQSQKITAGEAGFMSNITVGGKFGSSLTAIGDWNGDSIPDLLVGEPQGQLGPLAYGAVWLMLLERDGSVKEFFHLSGRTEGLTGLLARDERFGQDMAALGDLDGDGVGDFLIGSPMMANKGTGQVWTLFMQADGTVKQAVRLTSGENGFPDGELYTGDMFGYAVCAYGEPGSGRIYVGAVGEDDAGLNAGAVWKIELKPDGTAASAQKITSGLGFNPELDPDDRWGSAITQVGDWNGDGYPELVVGAFRSDAGGRDNGKLFVLFPDSVGDVAYVNSLYPGAETFGGKFSSAYQWGRSLRIGPDVDGDGQADLLVNGHLDDEGGSDIGSFWQVYPDLINPEGAARQAFQQKELKIGAADSAWIYRNAHTAQDSARVDSLYDLSGFAPSNLVFLLDISASMNKPLRLPLLRDAFLNLLPYMGPEDKISVITYSGKPELELSGLSAAQRDSITGILSQLQSAGSTKPSKAIKLAYEVARQHYIEGGNNRIIFATDGGFEKEDVTEPLSKLGTVEVPLSVFYFGKLPAFLIAEMQSLAAQGYGNTAHILPNTVEVALLNEVRVISKRE